jgi:hypothetical protein
VGTVTKVNRGENSSKNFPHIKPESEAGSSMTNEQQAELTQEMPLSPRLRSAVMTWYAARHRFQHEQSRRHQDAYSKATDELGQEFSRWKAEQPELLEQFRLWLHLES